MNFQVIFRIILFVTAIYITCVTYTMGVDHVFPEAVFLFQKLVTYVALVAWVWLVIVSGHVLFDLPFCSK